MQPHLAPLKNSNFGHVIAIELGLPLVIQDIAFHTTTSVEFEVRGNDGKGSVAEWGKAKKIRLDLRIRIPRK